MINTSAKFKRECDLDREVLLRLIARCGFHIDNLAEMIDEQHRPVVIVGAYGRELARYWYTFENAQVSCLSLIADDVCEAIDALPENVLDFTQRRCACGH